MAQNSHCQCIKRKKARQQKSAANIRVQQDTVHFFTQIFQPETGRYHGKMQMGS